MTECFHCGEKSVLWDSDFTGDEVYDNGDVDGVVHYCHCTECGAHYTIYCMSQKYKEVFDK